MSWIDIVVWIIFLIIVTTMFTFLYVRNKRETDKINTKLINLVNQINNAQYYEYLFDIQQDTNIKNIDNTLKKEFNNKNMSISND